MKSERNRRKSPIFGESPCNDIIISQKRHILTPKSLKTRCARDFMPGMVQYQEEGVMATMLIFAHLRISNSNSEAMAAYFH